MVQTFSLQNNRTFGRATAHPSDSTPESSHQDRVNVEMFRAIELLGKKLERAEGERDRLARRLALIESAATVDEKTGKLYLPVVMDQPLPPPPVQSAAPRWMVASSLMSSAIAFLALGVVFFRAPAAPQLTQEQLAALNALAAPKFAQFDGKAWQRVDQTEEVAQTVLPMPRQPTLPDDALLAADEETAADASAAVPAPLEVAEAPVIEPAAGEEQAASGASAIATAQPDEKPAEQKKTAKTVQVSRKEEPSKQTEKAGASAEPAPAMPASGEFATRIASDKALPKDLAALEQRAFDGLPEAQHDLATLYAAGQVIAQDYKRAAYWFSRAADGGVGNAHYNLGVMFQQGMGVRKDLARAIAWYEGAAKLGHPEAMYNLGIVYIEGVGTERDIDRGIAYFRQAANAGVAQAAFNLGVLYESNFMGPVDYAKAAEWYQAAAREGHADAEAALKRLQPQIGDVSDQALTLADMVEPAAGEEYGEGDASPAEEGEKADIRTIVKIQDFLARGKYLPSEYESGTGVADQKTRDAIRAWQKDAGLSVDGVPSAELLARMTR